MNGFEPTSAWTLKASGDLGYFEINRLTVCCRFFTRDGGVSTGPWQSLNVSFDVGDETAHVTENRARLQSLPGAKPLVLLRQTHSAVVRLVRKADSAIESVEGDALITDSPSLALGVKVADCLPIYLFAPGTPVVGLVHAGWRGTLGRIVEHAVAELHRLLRVGSGGLQYAFGPCIDAGSYVVGMDVVDQFRRHFPLSGQFLSPAEADCPAHFRLDLKAANRAMLNRLGTTEAADLPLSTYGRPDLFFSARRDGVTGRNLALIWSG